MEMSRWLAGRAIRLRGECVAIEQALIAHGAQLVDDAASDILVHIATPLPIKPVHELSHDEWRRRLDEGLDRRFLLAQEFARHRRAVQKCGAILFVDLPAQGLGTAQAGAAGALGNLVKTLSIEWARNGIRVNAILSHERGNTAGELAAYLVSDYAAYVTGMTMGIGPTDDEGKHHGL
jgi:NAD(P)-dependent dehydrogenase (short-subunit alcohol dehydrogenase family)